MSLPDASGQARAAALLLAAGAAARALLGVSGAVGKRLPRAAAGLLDTLSFILSAGLCALALFLGDGEARLTAYLIFFAGAAISSLPGWFYRRKRQEKRRRAENQQESAERG